MRHHHLREKLSPETYFVPLKLVQTSSTAFCANVNHIGPNDVGFISTVSKCQLFISLNIRYILSILLSMNLTCNVGFELSLLTQLRIAVGSRNLKDTEDDLIR